MRRRIKIHSERHRRLFLGARALTAALALTGCFDNNIWLPRPGYDSVEEQQMHLRIQMAADEMQYTTETCRVWNESSGVIDEVSFLLFADMKLKISASCLQSSGELACGAMDGLLAIPGKTVVIPRSFDEPRTAAILKIALAYCQAADSDWTPGNCCPQEQGFCKFADGSLIYDYSLHRTPRLVVGNWSPWDQQVEQDLP